jgi:hypothetical protein
VDLIVAPNPSATPRTGTVTIAGNLTFTVNQGPGIAVSLAMFDPARTSEATTECQIRGQPTTCVFKASAATYDGSPIVSYSWDVSYTYGVVKSLTQSGSNPEFAFTETCGHAGPTDDYRLLVSVKVTDSKGNTATAYSGSGGLTLRPFPCGS